MEAFGVMVEGARTKRGISQQDLADRIGKVGVEISGVQISRIETGQRKPSLGLFAVLVEVLELDPAKAVEALRRVDAPNDEARS